MDNDINADGDLAVFIKGHSVEERTIEDEFLLVNEETGAIFNLNPLGAAVWRLLRQPITSGEIIHVLAVAFPEVAEEQIQTDVRLLLRQLSTKGLISLKAE